MTIEVNNESAESVEEREFVELARFAFEQLHLHPRTELAVLFVDEDTMSGLHVQWMDEPGPTDVLSFPMDELRPGLEGSPTPEGLLGDLVICPSVAAAQALAAGHSTQEEMLLLAMHGILHLVGYDHAEPDEEREMFDLQRKLLIMFLAERREPSA